MEFSRNFPYFGTTTLYWLFKQQPKGHLAFVRILKVSFIEKCLVSLEHFHNPWKKNRFHQKVAKNSSINNSLESLLRGDPWQKKIGSLVYFCLLLQTENNFLHNQPLPNFGKTFYCLEFVNSVPFTPYASPSNSSNLIIRTQKDKYFLTFSTFLYNSFLL